MTAQPHRPLLIVIAGPNGSGKTSITHRLLNHEWLEDAVYINPDNVAQEVFGDWNSPEAVMKAVKHCEALREKCIQEKKSLIFETVLSGADKVDFIKRAAEAGYFIRIFFICTESPKINASRIAGRVMEGGHDVPLGKVISRYKKSILNCKKLSPFVDRLYLYDNSPDGKEAAIQCRLTKGEVAKRYVDALPWWAERILAAD